MQYSLSRMKKDPKSRVYNPTSFDLLAAFLVGNFSGAVVGCSELEIGKLDPSQIGKKVKPSGRDL
jgi:hypothetical protein